MSTPMEKPAWMKLVPTRVRTPQKRETMPTFASPDEEPSQQPPAKVARLQWTAQPAPKEDEGAEATGHTAMSLASSLGSFETDFSSILVNKTSSSASGLFRFGLSTPKKEQSNTEETLVPEGTEDKGASRSEDEDPFKTPKKENKNTKETKGEKEKEGKEGKEQAFEETEVASRNEDPNLLATPEKECNYTQGKQG